MEIKEASIQQLETEIRRRRAVINQTSVGLENLKAWSSPVTLWEITTEGDCEGRTAKHIAIEEGHIADLAFKYASEAYYELKFSPANTNKTPVKPPRNEIDIQLDIRSGTWDGPPDLRANAVRAWLGDGDFIVEPSKQYAAVKLKRTKK